MPFLIPCSPCRSSTCIPPISGSAQALWHWRLIDFFQVFGIKEWPFRAKGRRVHREVEEAYEQEVGTRRKIRVDLVVEKQFVVELKVFNEQREKCNEFWDRANTDYNRLDKHLPGDHDALAGARRICVAFASLTAAMVSIGGDKPYPALEQYTRSINTHAHLDRTILVPLPDDAAVPASVAEDFAKDDGKHLGFFISWRLFENGHFKNDIT